MSRKYTFILCLTAAIFVTGQTDSSQTFAQQSNSKAGQQLQEKPVKPADQKPSDEDPVPVTNRGNSNAPPPLVIPELQNNQLMMMGFPDINSKGQVVFYGKYKKDDTPQGIVNVLLVKSDAGLQVVVREGDKPVNADVRISEFGNPSIGDNGDIVFSASYRDEKAAEATTPQSVQTSATPGQTESKENKDRRKTGIFMKNAAGLRLLARNGDEVPRMPSTFGSIGNPTTNSKGMLAFIGTYIDPDGRGLFYLDASTDPVKLSLIVRSGQPSVTENKVVYSEHFYPSAINERGEVAFFVRLGDSGGMFVKRDKAVELIAQQGKEAPLPADLQAKASAPAEGGAEAGSSPEAPQKARYIGFGNQAPAISNKGDVAYVAFWDTQIAGRGLFVKEADKDGPPKLILRSGDPVGKTGATFSSFNNPAINSRGEVAFIGFYGGRTRGVFLWNGKEVEVVARAEDPVPGAKNGEVFNNFANVVLNDRGEVIFYGQIKNGTVGVFKRGTDGKLTHFIQRGEAIPVK